MECICLLLISIGKIDVSCGVLMTSVIVVTFIIDLISLAYTYSTIINYFY